MIGVIYPKPVPNLENFKSSYKEKKKEVNKWSEDRTGVHGSIDQSLSHCTTVNATAQGRIQGGGALGAQAPPSSQDNIQASIDIASSSTPF